MSEKPENPVSLASVIGKVVDGLKKQPVLLFTFGMAIVLLAAGALAFDNLRLILVGLLILALLGLLAWIFLQANKQIQSEKRTSPTSVDIGIHKSKVKPNTIIEGEAGIGASNGSKVNINIDESEIEGGVIRGIDRTGGEAKHTAVRK